ANFLILMVVLNIIFYKPLRKLMSSRNELIENLKTNAQIAKTRLEEGQAQQERFRVEVLQEGVKAQKELKEQGQAKETEILEETQKQAAEKIELAREAINLQVEKVRAELQSEAQDLANHLVNKLLGREVEAEN
ncbi:MAG: ATP synthase F0 subunit B, partial [Deltaproteobacteria bacterium]|nr:ATP synthase F0 subunit B [Deltaproteobacteria bacterium]